MNKALQWTIGISVSLIALAVVASAVLPFVAPALGWNVGGYGWGMMNGGHRFGGGMMEGGHMFGGVGGMMGGLGGFWLLGGLLRLVFFVLVGLGIVWLVRAASGNRHPMAWGGSPCPHCGKPVNADWKACPHCGEKLTGSTS